MNPLRRRSACFGMTRLAGVFAVALLLAACPAESAFQKAEELAR